MQIRVVSEFKLDFICVSSVISPYFVFRPKHIRELAAVAASLEPQVGDQSHAFPVAQTQRFAVLGNDGIAKQRDVDHGGWLVGKMKGKPEFSSLYTNLLIWQDHQ
jgi:hypothetical protein